MARPTMKAGDVGAEAQTTEPTEVKNVSTEDERILPISLEKVFTTYPRTER